MKEVFFQFIKENELSPFSSVKTYLKPNPKNIYKTRDAKVIHNKVLSKISSAFSFSETPNLFQCFPFTNNFQEIQKRQAFFQQIPKQINTDFLKQLTTPRVCWKPKYGIIAVTSNEDTFSKLKALGCVTQFVINQDDVAELEKYDIVQVIDCEEFQMLLETLPQTVFIDSVENAYLERYLELLSAWKENIEIIKQNPTCLELNPIIQELEPLLPLLNKEQSNIMNRQIVEDTLENINHDISQKVKEMTLSGDAVLRIVGEGKMPPEIQTIIDSAIKKNNIPEEVLNRIIPVSIDEQALEHLIRKQSANEFTDIAEKVKANAQKLKQIPQILNKLSSLLLVLDFNSGISKFMQTTTSFPQNSQIFQIQDSKNIFLENAQPVSFNLSQEYQCSILTGANSGGKTTLLEHILQLISLFQLGLPVNGSTRMPIFTEVYYFAKTKGSMSKGAFETLLTQMSQIKPGTQTLILADEIEAVTEPGVAGKIISSTADYFIKKNCFLVIASHLGYEIQKTLPQKARMDGIEAKGLDQNFNLIVDHNPVLGRLAHSTPELIVERMANANSSEYFQHIWDNLKNNNI